MANSARKTSKMSVDELIKWAMGRPEGKRYELFAGEVAEMAPEWSIHAQTKFRVARCLAESIEATGLPCTVYPDGMAVMVDEETIHEPDAFVRCGEQLPDDAVFVTDPVIVVKVLSPSTSAVDTGNKFTDYFRLASVRHYLLIRPDKRTVVHHERDAAGDISTRIVHDGTVRLDPPGLDLADIFERAP